VTFDDGRVFSLAAEYLRVMTPSAEDRGHGSGPGRTVHGKLNVGIADVESVGVTAGASAPETLVQGVLEGLRQFGEIDISTLAGVAEDVRFRFPAQLADAAD